jgi:hypothetical protein
MEKFIPFVLGAQRPLMSSVDIDKALIKIDEVTNIQEHYTSYPHVGGLLVCMSDGGGMLRRVEMVKQD